MWLKIEVGPEETALDRFSTLKTLEQCQTDIVVSVPIIAITQLFSFSRKLFTDSENLLCLIFNLHTRGLLYTFFKVHAETLLNYIQRPE